MGCQMFDTRIEPSDDDVVSVPDIGMTPVKHPTLKAAQVRKAFSDILRQHVTYDWFNTGIECEFLKTTGGGWKKGRLRIRLEFIPNEPTEPEFLDSSALALPPSSDQ